MLSMNAPWNRVSVVFSKLDKNKNEFLYLLIPYLLTPNTLPVWHIVSVNSCMCFKLTWIL